MISAEQLAALQAAYARDEPARRAAKSARVSEMTASRYFKVFAGKNPARLRSRWGGPGKLPGLPVYDGPDWIGKACP